MASKENTQKPNVHILPIFCRPVTVDRSSSVGN